MAGEIKRAAKGNFPRRIEAGLCPDLEDALAGMVGELMSLAQSVRGLSFDGLVGAEGVALQIEAIAGRAAAHRQEEDNG